MDLKLPQEFFPDRVSIQQDVPANTVFTMAELEGAGCIRHFWISLGLRKNVGRNTILRIYFDGAARPQVEAPVNDFFGIMHGQLFYPINTEYIAVLEKEGRNCYFAMPFANGARIEIETGPESIFLAATVDWHRYEALEEKRRFCARWRRENPTESYGKEYFMLDAEGPGELVGFFYGVKLIDNDDRWSHGGSENIYIDGETDNPVYIRGIGGEDTFGTSFGGAIHTPETMLYTGMPYYAYEDTHEARPAQRVTGYRFFKHERIPFRRSVRMRFGCMRNDICSTVYWYSEKAPIEFFPINHESIANPPAYKMGESNWKVFGPLPDRCNLDAEKCMARALSGEFDFRIPLGDIGYGTEDCKEAVWLDGAGERGFLDFRHYFRVRQRGVSPTEDGSAIAVCDLIAKNAGTAVLRMSYDDKLTVLTESARFDLPEHRAFRTESISVKLKKGRNRMVVHLTNTLNTNKGGWCFAMKGIDGAGEELSPSLPSNK